MGQERGGGEGEASYDVKICHILLIWEGYIDLNWLKTTNYSYIIVYPPPPYLYPLPFPLPLPSCPPKQIPNNDLKGRGEKTLEQTSETPRYHALRTPFQTHFIASTPIPFHQPMSSAIHVECSSVWVEKEKS